LTGYYKIFNMEAKQRVLVIDDEPGVIRFVKINLALAGYEVITATSGEEALPLVESMKPDIMLLDILMTPISGFDILVELRMFSQLPVIVFTARNDIGNMAMKEGANGFIAKPFKPDELIGKIREILNKKRTKDQADS
jgi:DNA-binding response OmpR family regulator